MKQTCKDSHMELTGFFLRLKILQIHLENRQSYSFWPVRICLDQSVSFEEREAGAVGGV